MAEAYSYFFMTLPDVYREDLTKFFEGETPTGIHSAYKCVRTLEMAKKWTSSVPDKGKRRIRVMSTTITKGAGLRVTRGNEVVKDGS